MTNIEKLGYQAAYLPEWFGPGQRQEALDREIAEAVKASEPKKEPKKATKKRIPGSNVLKAFHNTTQLLPGVRAMVSTPLAAVGGGALGGILGGRGGVLTGAATGAGTALGEAGGQYLRQKLVQSKDVAPELKPYAKYLPILAALLGGAGGYQLSKESELATKEAGLTPMQLLGRMGGEVFDDVSSELSKTMYPGVYNRKWKTDGLVMNAKNLMREFKEVKKGIKDNHRAAFENPYSSVDKKLKEMAKYRGELKNIKSERVSSYPWQRYYGNDIMTTFPIGKWQKVIIDRLNSPALKNQDQFTPYSKHK
jgi:hypothetical protein